MSGIGGDGGYRGVVMGAAKEKLVPYPLRSVVDGLGSKWKAAL